MEPFYFLLAFGITVVAGAAFITLRPPSSLAIKKCDIFALLYVIISFASIIAGDARIFYDSITVLITVTFVYFFIRIFIESNGSYIWIFAITSLIFIFEIALIIQQLKFTNGQNSLFLIGTLNNSNLIGEYIVCLAPFLIFFARKIKISYLRLPIVGLVFISSFSIAILTQSRGATFSLLCLLIYYFFHFSNRFYKSKKTKTIIIGISCIVLFIGLVWSSIYLKTDSALGRILIWKVALPHILVHPFLGYGFGSFPINYSYWQGNFFYSNGLRSNLWQFADISYSAFNDFLQIILEVGFLGVTLFIFFAGNVLFITTSTPKLNFETPLKGSIICILFSALVSYPLHCFPILLTLFIGIALLTNLSNEKPRVIIIKKLGIRAIAIVLILCLIYPEVLWYKQLSALDIWKTNKQGILDNDLNAERRINEVMPEISRSGPLLFELGQIYYLKGEYPKALNILEKSQSLITKEDAFYYIGDIYLRNNDFPKACQSFYSAYTILPDRIRPKCLLANTYFQMGDYKNASLFANLALKTELRVTNPDIEDLKTDMRGLISKIKNLHR